jgi:hypothetical protein
MKTANIVRLTLFGFLAVGAARADTVDDLLNAYRSLGAGPFSVASGNALWQRSFPADNGSPRACTSCHNTDPRKSGRHATTGKAVEPMARSVNAKRLTEQRQIEKWFKRNCKWTLGRECTAQEKGDLLSFLRTQ